MNRPDNIKKEDALIIWKNFSGTRDSYNPDGGKRSFNLVLTPEEAQVYLDEGWHIKKREPKDGEGETLYYLPCKVSYSNKPPKVCMITGKNKVVLDEDTIGILDDKEFERADVVITPYIWKMGGKEGIAAYLKTLYVVPVKDEFEDKYGRFDEVGPDNDEIPFG